MICEECGQDFSEGKPTPGAALGLHRFRAHGIRSQNPAGGKKGPARRRADRPSSRSRATPVPAPVSAPEPPPPLFEPPEEPVVPRKRGFLKDWFSRAPATPGEIRPAKVGRPRKSHRTSFAPVGSLAWMGGSQMAASMGSVPVSRAMQLQVGIAGDVLDKAVEGTRLDRLVQPFLGDTERFRDLGMLMAFPLLVGVCQAQPDNPMAAGLLEMIVRENLHALADGVKRMRAEDRKLADTVETLTGVGIDLGDNPVHAILSMIFAPVEPTRQSSPVGWAPGPVPEAAPPAPAPPGPEANGQVPASEPLPFGAVIITPADVPPGL